MGIHKQPNSQWSGMPKRLDTNSIQKNLTWISEEVEHYYTYIMNLATGKKIKSKTTKKTFWNSEEADCD